MEQLTTSTNDLAVLDAAVLEKPNGRLDFPNWLRRYRPARAGALLSSFPSGVFLLALTFYITLTFLHIWLYGTAPAAHGVLPTLVNWGTSFTTAWRRFDSYYFLHIAQFSYTDQGLGAFFPLYPLLIRIFAWPLAGHYTLAALLVSWLCAWGSYLWFYRLAEREFGARVARYALLFLALTPMSFFSFAPYSESLFLLVSIGAVERARAGRLWQASALAALGMLCRPTGILLLIPLAWEWARRAYLADKFPGWLNQRIPGWLFQTTPSGKPAPEKAAVSAAADKPLPRLAWLSLALVPLALLGYMLFLKVHNGNALAFLTGESLWHRHLTPPWETVGLFQQAIGHAWQVKRYTLIVGNVVDLLLVIPLPIFVLYTAIRKKNLWMGAALYLAALAVMLIAVPSYPGPHYGEEILLSTQRFMLPAFPIFLLLGQFETKHPWLYRAILVASSIFLLMNTWNFLHNSFVA